MKRRSLSRLWPLVYIFPALAVFWPVLAQIRQVVAGAPATPFTDAVGMFYPFRAFANGELQQGRLPLWNPYLLCGHSLHGDGQGAIFYPLNLLFAPLSAAVSMNLFALLHFAAAGTFFSLYLRACGLRRFGAFFGGFVYMFSSAPISRLFAGHYTIIPFLALAPALMLAWESWRRGRRWDRAVWGGVCVGGMILSGYPQVLLYAMLFLAWHALLESGRRFRKQPGKAALEPLLFVAGVVLLGSCLGAVQLLPSVVFARESIRGATSYDAIATFSFSPENLVTLLLPGFFGNLAEGDTPYWGRHLLWENWIFIGIIPLALSIMALLRVRKPVVVAHGLALPVFFALALGKHTPLHRFLYDHVPLFSFFRGSSKFSFFVLFSLAALAGVGCDRLLRETDPARQRGQRFTIAATLAVFAAVGVLLGVILGANPAAAGSPLERLVQWRFAQGETYLPFDFANNLDPALVWGQIYSQVLLLGAVALVGILVVGCWPVLRRKPWLACTALGLAVFPQQLLFSAGESLTASISPPAASSLLLREVVGAPDRSRVLAPEFPRNALVPYRVESPLGYVGNMTRRYNDFLTAANGVERSALMVETPVLRLDRLLFWPAVSHVALSDKVRLPEDFATPLLRDRDQVLYRVKDVQRRATFASGVSISPSSDAALSDLEGGVVDLYATDLLEVPAGRARPLFEPAAPGDVIAVDESLPLRTTIRTSAAGPRLLVLADSFESGWRARLEDGRALEIYPVNIAFRAVLVPRGDHTVTFTYEPRLFLAGAAVSLLALLGVAGFGGGLLVRARKGRTSV